MVRESPQEDNVAKDLRAAAMPELDWSQDRALDSLRAIYCRSEKHAMDTVAWYLREKQAMSRTSRTLRAAAIFFIVLGGIVPLVSVAAPTVIHAPWGYVLLAIGAGCVAYDRFFGYSASWIRYMRTQFALQRILTEFQYDWAAHLASLGVTSPSSDQVDDLMSVLRNFSAAVIELVEEETFAWASDLSEQISRLERAAEQ